MKIRAWLWAVVAVGLLFTVAEAGKLDRCIARCERTHGTPVPTASPTPAATLAPIPCEPVGTKTFAEGQQRMLCFTAGAGGPFVEVSTQNHGNATCADFWMQMYSPNGAVSEPSFGVQPGAIMQRVPGRYYLATTLREANSVACATLTFTVR